MSLFTTWFGMFFLVCCWAIHHWFSQKMCLLFGASSWEDGLRMFIFGKNCAGCMVRELYGWRRVDAGALMFILFQLMQLTFFTVGHPSSAQGLWIGEFTFGRIHLLVDLSLSCIYSTPLVLGHLDFTNLWKPVNRIRIIMGILGCTWIRTSMSCRSKKKKYFCNIYFRFLIFCPDV